MYSTAIKILFDPAAKCFMLDKSSLSEVQVTIGR